MAGGLDYDATVRVLRAALADVAANARAFDIRARARPELLSSRGWAELSQIETLLSARIEQALQRELRVEPRPLWTRLLIQWRTLRIGLAGERGVISGLLHEDTHSPVERWRDQAPQLEALLWPFFVARTHYLANTLALALNQPGPFPPLLWHPGRREFQQGATSSS